MVCHVNRVGVLVLAFGCALAQQPPDVDVVVPDSAAHTQDWLRPRFRDNPNPNYQGKPVDSLADFAAPEVISRIVVDQFAGPSEDVRRYLVAMPVAAVKLFGPSLKICRARLVWTSTSTVTFASGKTGRLAVASLAPAGNSPQAVGLSPALPPDCVGADKVGWDSLYVRYADPDGYSWYFAVPFQRNQ